MNIVKNILLTCTALAVITFCICMSIVALHFNGELGYIDEAVRIGTRLFHQYYDGFMGGI
jgi:hypothetical protein